MSAAIPPGRPMSFGEWLATKPLGRPVPEETAMAMQVAWHAGIAHAPCQCYDCRRFRGEKVP